MSDQSNLHVIGIDIGKDVFHRVGFDADGEIALRRALHARGFRYRLHHKSLPGRPDLVFPKYQAVVFVHGCFWHRHPGCSKATNPATRVEFWRNKFEENIKRDRRNMDSLRKVGWRALVVWECELSRSSIDDVADHVSNWLKTDQFSDTA
ncbi:MAG TPA: very short patch repair endonuclease [Afifellaceae bacterium]|nr:very short patch repair endonuclease [Afifellaceae bacterium]